LLAGAAFEKTSRNINLKAIIARFYTLFLSSASVIGSIGD
jgi:hypothetical protein